MPNFISNSIFSSSRLHSIDTLRGLVMLFMLLDRAHEAFFLHRQVGGPMGVASTEPTLFLNRILVHLCAPVFAFLTGLSIFLYGEEHQGCRAVSAFLFKCGLSLVVLKLALVNFAWIFQLPPTVIYLQVTWVVGLSMLALVALLWLPCPLLAALGVLLVVGHSLPDPLHFASGLAWYLPRAVPHDRDWIETGDTLRLCISYPLPPWIGVIVLGYTAGSWFGGATPVTTCRRYLLVDGGGLLFGLILLRLPNGYNEKPWTFSEMPAITLMGFFNVTKYPSLLLFLVLILGISPLSLAQFECLDWNGRDKTLVAFGGTSMSFYLLHLYLLKLLYLLALVIWDVNRGGYPGFSSVPTLWLCSVLLAVVLYPVVHWFAGFKTRRQDTVWLKYF